MSSYEGVSDLRDWVDDNYMDDGNWLGGELVDDYNQVGKDLVINKDH